MSRGWQLEAAELEPVVRAVVRNRVRDDFEDVAQDAMLSLCGALPRQRRSDEPLVALAVTIAQRRAADYWRARYRARSLVVPMVAIDDDGVLPDGPDPAPGPEDRVVAADAAAALWRLVAQLPARQREVVELRFGAELSPEEAAAVLGCSPVAVRTAQSYALARLRRLLYEVAL